MHHVIHGEGALREWHVEEANSMTAVSWHSLSAFEDTCVAPHTLASEAPPAAFVQLRIGHLGHMELMRLAGPCTCMVSVRAAAPGPPHRASAAHLHAALLALTLLAGSAHAGMPGCGAPSSSRSRIRGLHAGMLARAPLCRSLATPWPLPGHSPRTRAACMCAVEQALGWMHA